MQQFKKYFFKYFELIIWVSALLLLAIMDPAADNHYSLCFFKWAGLSFCPGCGLGHAISWLFRGELVASLNAHPLGILALAVLLHRIYVLIKRKNLFFTT